MTDDYAKRVLFVIRSLPRAVISVRGLVSGQEAMSGTHSATLLVVDGLARRGWDVAVLVINGSRLTETAVTSFHDFDRASSWLGNGRAVWSYFGDEGIMEGFSKWRIRPLVWSHIDLTSEVSDWLAQERIEGVVTVSDFSRVALLHHSRYRRIARIYNPLNPFYMSEGETEISTTEHTLQVVFAGYIGESKGAHRLFQHWPHVRRALPHARLVVAGSAKLYREENSLGAFGVATDEFEKRYIYPLTEEFGSLENAGVHLAGLLSPADLRQLYKRSSLGVVNLNWQGSGETFSCTAVEMAACGLRVFSVASGALPETVGITGNAVLVTSPEQVLPALIQTLSQPRRLANVELARQRIRGRYQLSHIIDRWDNLLLAEPDRFFELAGPWQFDKDFRYILKRTFGRLHAGWLLDRMLELRSRNHRAGG